jgi:hypothetical protein
MRQRHIAVAEAGRRYRYGSKTSGATTGDRPWSYNPFVLVNYSPTICLNPPPYLRKGDGLM